MKIEDVKKLSVTKRFLYFIEERERVRLSKEVGLPKPWSDNEILQSYRFCNVRRADDKVSQWLIKNWYEPFFDHPNMLYAVALARFFNTPDTLRNIQADIFHGPPGQRVGTKFDISKPPDWERMKKTVRNIKADGYTVFNGAYMVRGNDGVDKVSSVVDFYVGSIVKVQPKIIKHSMEETHANLLQCYGMGSFMAGQIVADLRWAVSGTWMDKDHWAPVGPGSSRGMNRLMGRDPKKLMNQFQFLTELWDFMNLCRDSLPESITGRLEAHDYQNVLCECDKVERILEGSGKPKQLYPGVK